MLSGFLRSRSEAYKRKRSEFEATPGDVVDLLVHRCMTGDVRTMVLAADCVTRETGSCEYPRRMGESAVCALASKLPTRLYELGCVGQWSSSTFGGNPGDSALVHKYVAAVEEAQQTLRTKPENSVLVHKTCEEFDVVVTSVKTFTSIYH